MDGLRSPDSELISTAPQPSMQIGENGKKSAPGRGESGVLVMSESGPSKK